MTTLAVNQFANLKDLTRAVIRESPFRVLKRDGGVPDKLFEILFIAPAMIADWILQNTKHLAAREELRIGVVSATSRGVEVIDDGRWYAALPDLLGNPRLKVQVSLIRGPEPESVLTPLSALKLPFKDAKTYPVPLHTYLENSPDGEMDLLVLVDADAMAVNASSWASPLADLIAAGTPVVAIAASADEYMLIEGLLGLFGFGTKAAPYKNRFSTDQLGPFGLVDNLTWGSYLWEVTSSPGTKGTTPGKALKEEALQTVRFVRTYSKRHEAYPPLTKIGASVEGAESPAKDGRHLVVLPENLYFDPVNEKLGVKVEGELVSLKGLDNYAAKSAVLSAYEGRDSRFMQLLWAVHVFEDCVELLPSSVSLKKQAEDAQVNDESDDEADGAVCPSCGEVHTAEDRVEGVRHLLGKLLDDETPAVKLKAALQVALEAANAGGLGLNQPEQPGRRSGHKDEMEAQEIYELLMDRGYVRAAFGMWQEEPELDEDGRDEDGWPLAMLAIFEGEFSVLEEMLESEIGFECFSEDGSSVFHALAMLEPLIADELPDHLAETFCQLGVDPNTPDEDGERPLETAAMGENWTVFAMLVDCGADIGGTRINIESVLEQMREQGATEIADKVAAKLKKSAPRTRKNGDPGKGSPTKSE
jgi:hypothetical protein